MKRSAPVEKFKSEAEMCALFCDWARIHDWTPYPETGGWDVLLVRSDGYQIGVEAKLRLNAEVVNQALEDDYSENGPDFRAVLVPEYATDRLTSICARLGITVITARGPGTLTADGDLKRHYSWNPAFRPALPTPDDYRLWGPQWFERCPWQRHMLPDYVPDVAGGALAPVQLTFWKIQAIKIAVLLEKNGFVTRADFKALRIDARRWLENGWLRPGADRTLVAGPTPRDFKTMHPRNYEEIKGDIAKWAPPAATPIPEKQKQLFEGRA